MLHKYLDEINEILCAFLCPGIERSRLQEGSAKKKNVEVGKSCKKGTEDLRNHWSLEANCLNNH